MKTEYKIVSVSTSAEYLVTAVQEKLDEGWELFGAPYAVACGAAMYHYQAMIKKDKPQPVRGTYRTFDDQIIGH